MIGCSQETHNIALSPVFPQEGHFKNGSEVDIEMDNPSSHWIPCSDFLQFSSLDHKVMNGHCLEGIARE